MCLSWDSLPCVCPGTALWARVESTSEEDQRSSRPVCLPDPSSPSLTPGRCTLDRVGLSSYVHMSLDRTPQAHLPETPPKK